MAATLHWAKTAGRLCCTFGGSAEPYAVKWYEKVEKKRSRESVQCMCNIFSGVIFLYWLLFRYPFHPCLPQEHVKDPGHSAKSAGGRLQLNTHTPYLCGFEWSDTVTWCMVEWCTQNLGRNGSISRGTSHATTTERCQYTTSVDINNTRYEMLQSLIQNHMPMCTVSLLESRK